MDHVEVNRLHWNGLAKFYARVGQGRWAENTPIWGAWDAPDDQVSLLPADMTGLAAVELGCGTGYVSAWMVRRGARVTAIDISENQLATARQLADEHQVEIDFHLGNAEDTGFAAETFDFAVSEYGAAIWCEPRLWLAEAFRLLKPGGHLAFLGSHPLVTVATPPNGAATQHQFHRSYRHLDRTDWSDAEIEPGGIEFNMSLGNWFSLFHQIGFKVLDYKELYASVDFDDTDSHISRDWAQDYPVEQVWWLQKS